MSKRALHSLFKPKPSRQQRRRAQRHFAKRDLQLEQLEDRMLLAVGPQLIGINPNDGDLLEEGDVRNIAPLDLTFRFDESQVIDPNSLNGIQITRSGLDGTFGEANDVAIQPGFVGIGEAPNEVIFRFAEALPDDVYRIDIFGSGPTPLRNMNGALFDDDPVAAGNQDFRREFELDLGAQIVAVVPQPVERVSGVLKQRRNEIVVYFNDDNLLDDATSAENPDFYQLIFTNDTVTNEDDQVFHPTSVDYDPDSDTAVLTFADSLENLPLDQPPTSPLAGRTYRLRIGTAEPLPLAPELIEPLDDPGSSFDTATDLLGTFGFTFAPGDDMRARSTIISSAIEPQPFALDLPGSNSEPGHRKLSAAGGNQHLSDESADRIDGISVFAYNFESVFAQDANGNPLINQITERQKDRAREVFELYSEYLGVEFIETEDLGFTIATGDLHSVAPPSFTDVAIAIPDIPGFGPTVVLNATEVWNNQFGANWFQEAIQQIGHLLGLGSTFDLPEGTIQGSDPGLTFGTPAEPVFPGDHDIVHGQHLFRPDSNDIDLYRFTLADTGLFTAETIAQRQTDASQLDTNLRLYRETSSGRELIARNDDYFSNDSFLEMELGPGTYFVGVSASGNDQYDPTIEDTGFGGTSQGPYDLRLGFRPDADKSIVDADRPDLLATPLDGDADGRPGGVFNFWFRSDAPSAGQADDPARTIFVDKSHTPLAGQPLGTQTNPFNNIAEVLVFDPVANPGGARPGDIVRIVGNGLDTSELTDDEAYEIGVDSLGRPLTDGARLDIPQGVTVMVEAGAIFKIRNSAISVGSSSPAVDRSAAVFQVLGTPRLLDTDGDVVLDAEGNIVPGSVFFTSINDESIGLDSTPLPSTPGPGDWGGIIFRDDVDRQEGRFVYDNEGIFLNYVNQADLRYGGRSVVVGASSQVVNPIHLIDTRPTISFNRITFSADAAISASPNSFAETNFQAPRFQDTAFTSDYTRVGPDIHGNRLIDNTTGGLSIRVPKLAGNVPQPLTISGRFDDTDIVHVLADNLILQGSPGGPVQDPFTGELQARTNARLKIDPGTIVKLSGARIEAQIGADFFAEGTAERPIVFTSLEDDRFGAGGTFDTNNNGDESLPNPGDWAGIVVNQTSIGSIDHAVIAFGGGINPLEGSFAGINPVEIHQGEARITNTLFENNASGVGGLAPRDRFGRGFNAPAAIFVRGAQPIIVDNVFRGNDGPVVNINVNSLNHFIVTDRGRSTGPIDRILGFGDNQGPLIRRNFIGDNTINGLEVRGGTLTTESVWDDTDIVHVLRDTIFVPNFHTFGGLRLQSSPNESLVVKLLGEDAGFTTTGTRLEIADMIGGRLQVVGQPGHPVVLTSLFDDTVGAGFDDQSRPQTDTNGGGRPVRTGPGGTFKIDLNFGPIISLNPAAMEAARRAASIWELQLQDPITVVVDVELADLGPAPVGPTNPNFLMQTTTDRVNLDFNTVRDALASDAGDHEALVKELPSLGQLNVDLPIDPLNPFTVANTLQLTRANAQALGFSRLPGTLSAFDPLGRETRDGQILINSNPQLIDANDGLNNPINNNPTIWDFDRSDGLDTYKEDFVSVFLGEIGKILGFISSVDDVNAALDGAAPRDIELTPLDLFRFEPGGGHDDFTNAPRLLNPLVPDHVFFAGGSFDANRLGLPISGFEPGDIPLAKGRELGDELNDFGAGHWLDDVFFRDARRTDFKPIGVMDPISQLRDDVFQLNDPIQSTVGLINNITEQDREAFDAIGYDVVGGAPADWRGIRLEQLTHDFNAPVVLESEGADVSAPGTNGTPEAAQFVGMLAKDMKSGDDNQRLAFEIHGLISAPADVDVYSFTAAAGTEVWLDIDRTSPALDSVLELIDANGTVLARSDNSPAEVGGSEFVTGIGQPLSGQDHYTTNPRDAGMQLVLPGEAGVTSTYLVRVRSSSPDLDGDLTGGLTSGQYQLQVRLRATDEVPGTSVQFADIRYAQTGVDIIGPPIHSPLLGDQVEDDSFNDTPFELPVVLVGVDDGMPADPPVFVQHSTLPFDVSAQHLGNLLATDQGAISVFGSLATSGDVDFYRVDVAFNDLESVFARQRSPTAGVVFDIDFAAGLGRPNTALSVFDAGGKLIFFSDQSNVPDDLDPNTGFSDLSRGSTSAKDPFIGPVVLSEGTYFVAVSSIARVPSDIASSTATLQPIIEGAVDRGQRVSGATGSTVFAPNPDAPLDATLAGEYQLEIRYTPVPTGGFTESNAAAADKNRTRVQGQIIIDSNTIRDSFQWGIVVEAGLRDLPLFSFRGLNRLFNAQPHAQFTTGDYIPHAGAPRALPVLDEERIVPGLTFKNNVIAGGVQGGIQLSGDPGGIIIDTFNLADDTDDISSLNDLFDVSGRLTDPTGAEFTIWDHNGNFATFEFVQGGGAVGEPGHIPIRFDLDPANDPPIFADQFRHVDPPTLAEPLAAEIEHAIRTTNLDVKVFHGQLGQLFVEGAVEINNPDILIAPANSLFGFPPVVTFQKVQQGAVPFARVVNNTLVGRGGDLFDARGAGDVGISLEDNVSPTILNNIITNFDTGIRSDLTSTDQPIDRRTFIGGGTIAQSSFEPIHTGIDNNGIPFSGPPNSVRDDLFNDDPVPFCEAGFGLCGFGLQFQDIDLDSTPFAAPRPTVIGATVYQGNLDNNERVGVGDFPIQLANDDPLFINAAQGNFLLEEGSLAIDSSIDRLGERDRLAAISAAVGIAASDILAPDLDVRGQQRGDDPSVEPPAGFGSNVFKDRGALDRVDFVGPTTVLVNPVDNDSAGVDQDATDTALLLFDVTLSDFSIQLVDGVSPADPAAGTGIDDSTVTRDTVTVTQDGVLLEEGIDYLFTYDETNDVIRLTPIAGVWQADSTYLVTLDNSSEKPIRDLAGNPLKPNSDTGTTQFTIVLAPPFVSGDFGDAPESDGTAANYPTLLSSDGARHIIIEGFFLGSSVDAELDGQPSSAADGDGADEDGVTFETPLDIGFDATITVVASEPGLLDAWIDFNSDGDWDDPGEQIFASEPLVAGENTLSISVPLTATNGDTFARFRLSSSGGLSPRGLAVDGEVEDYLVTITGSAWQNGMVPLNVNGSTDVDGNPTITPLDALLIINELNNPQFSDPFTGLLPSPPVAPNIPIADPISQGSFVDVNGDGFISPIDALRVINFLNTQPSSSSLTNLSTTGSAKAVSAGVSAGLLAGLPDGVEEDDVVMTGISTSGKFMSSSTSPFDMFQTAPMLSSPRQLAALGVEDIDISSSGTTTEAMFDPTDVVDMVGHSTAEADVLAAAQNDRWRRDSLKLHDRVLEDSERIETEADSALSEIASDVSQVWQKETVIDSLFGEAD